MVTWWRDRGRQAERQREGAEEELRERETGTGQGEIQEGREGHKRAEKERKIWSGWGPFYLQHTSGTPGGDRW